jgi:C4-dicarboxylate-specific signal transduction histidine kinase
MKRPSLAGNRLRDRIIWATSLQLLLVSSAVGGMAYFSGQRSGLSLTDALRQQDSITDLSEQLSGRLRAPQLINNLNVLAIRQGQLSLTDFDAMGQRFWSQMQLFPVGYINFGNPAGEFLGVERLDSGAIVLNEDAITSPLGKGTLGIFALGAKGERGPLLETVPDMTTTHEEAWYVETVKAGKATWSSIYQWEDKPEVLAISYNEPLYGPNRRLLGVIGVDFVLSQLNTWLAEVWKDTRGFALIVEPNGMVVASSRPGFTSTGTGNTTRRVRIDQLRDPLVQAASRTLFRPGPNGSLQPRSEQTGALTAAHNGHTFWLGLHPWGQREGLNWLLITANQSDQVVQTSQRYALIALLLSLAAVAVAVVVTIRVGNWLLGPLEVLRRRCGEAATQVTPATADPVFDSRLPAGTAVEIEAVSQAFQALVERLTQAKRQLAEAMERERLKDAQTVLVLEDKLKSSLKAAAIAHEINLPLSTLLLNSKLLLEQSDAPLDLPLQGPLRAIADNADAVVTTIEKMRTLLRNVQTHHQVLNLAHVTRNALLYASPSLKAAGITVQRQGLDQRWPVLGDAAQIQIAVVNLLRNALEALESSGSAPAVVEVSLERRADTVVLTVADNGPGFQSPETALEPLATSKPSGSGLGLFVVQTTMDNHHGRVVVGRSPLGGAAVQLLFPAAAEPTAAEPDAPPG